MFYIPSSPDQKKEAECNAYMTVCRKYRLNVPCKLGNLLVIGLIIPYEQRIVHPKISQKCLNEHIGWQLLLLEQADMLPINASQHDIQAAYSSHHLAHFVTTQQIRKMTRGSKVA